MNASRFDDDEPIAPVTNINSAFPGAAAHRSPDLVEGIEPYRLRLRRRLAKLGGALHIRQMPAVVGEDGQNRDR